MKGEYISICVIYFLLNVSSLIVIFIQNIFSDFDVLFITIIGILLATFFSFVLCKNRI